MALYPVGSVVYAGKEMITPACGDHPTFLHARYGDALYVIEHRPGKEYPYLLADNKEGKEAFTAKATELMGQRPFKYN